MFKFPAIVLALVCLPLAHADMLYTVTFNTASLAGNGPFTLDFQFFDGTGIAGDLNNNSVTLTNFAFGGGTALGGGVALGGASGSLSSGVLLHDTVFFNDYSEDFTPGTLLKFDLAITNVFNPSGTPDLFTMAILDSQGFEIPTTGFADEFLAFSLEGGVGPVITTANSAPGAAFSISAPVVTANAPSAVPEPSSWILLLSAAALGVGARFRRR
jgi:hypothetical protein